MTRFHPLGLGPFDGGNADVCYANIDYFDYIAQANQERFVAVQIEDPEPLDELDEIAAVEGIDILFFGPVDFAQAIGKFASTIVSPATIDESLEVGYCFIAMGDDMLAISLHCKSVLTELAKHGASSGPTEQPGWMFDSM